MHRNNKLVAVWVDTKAKSYQEGEEFYRQVYDLGVDMLTTDFPLVANEILQKYHNQLM